MQDVQLSPQGEHLGCASVYGGLPKLWSLLGIRPRIAIGTQKGTIILTIPHMVLGLGFKVRQGSRVWRLLNPKPFGVTVSGSLVEGLGIMVRSFG